MNQTLRTYVLSLLLVLVVSPVWAGYGDVVDFGEMSLDTPYTMKGDFSDYVGQFTAPKDGVLVVSSSSSGSFMSPYSDATYNTPINYDISMTQNGVSYELAVTAGTVYYFHANFCMNDATITLSMGERAQLTLLDVVPQNGSTYSLSGNGLISLSFNKYVKIGSACIVVGETTSPLVTNAYGANVSIDAKATVHSLLTDGTLTPGQSFSVQLKNVTTQDGSLCYGTDGTLTINYVCGDRPIQLSSSQILADSTFLSYWAQGDEGACITLTFDGELQPTEGREQEAVAIISYGDLDTGDYYQEKQPYTVKGNTLIADFSGKFRRPKDMVASATKYDNINVKIAAVRDTKGNYAYNASSASLGAFSFNFPYVEVKADIITDFYPTSGSSLKGVNEIEFWITDYEMLHHDGPAFLINDGEKTDTIVATYTVAPDSEYEGAYLLIVEVHEKVKQSRHDVVLTLLNVQCADGVDHTADLTARYTPATTDGIQQLPTNATQNGKIYDLHGRPVSNGQLHKGVYVVDSKKIIKK